MRYSEIVVGDAFVKGDLDNTGEQKNSVSKYLGRPGEGCEHHHQDLFWAVPLYARAR
jgi:hypothetical protein